MKAIKPDINTARMLVETDRSIPTAELFKDVRRLEPSATKKLVNAIPYYLLAYGKNLELLVPLIKQPMLALIVSGFGKALKAAANYYKIKPKDLM